MKKITLILLALCVMATLFTAVACNDEYDEYEETPDVSGGALDLDTNDGAVTAPPSDEDSEDNAYINAAPANDEQGWGALTPRP